MGQWHRQELPEAVGMLSWGGHLGWLRGAHPAALPLLSAAGLRGDKAEELVGGDKDREIAAMTATGKTDLTQGRMI